MKPATQNPDQSPSPNLRSAYIYKGCQLFSCGSLWRAGFTVFLPGRQCLQLFQLCRHPVPLHALHLSFLPLAKKCTHAALQDAQIPLHDTGLTFLQCKAYTVLVFYPFISARSHFVSICVMRSQTLSYSTQSP